MRNLIVPLQLLSLLGFALAVAAHVASLLNLPLPQEVMSLHIGIFIVYIPAILFSRPKFKRLQTNTAFLTKPLSSWNMFFEGCPEWMKYLTGVLFIYAFGNFFWCAEHLPAHQTQSAADFAQTVRMFSGHWMIFYWGAFVFLYSAQRSPPVVCSACGNVLPQGAEVCPQCGQAVVK